MQQAVVTAVVEATRKAHATWKRGAQFRNITIQGAIARGSPGCLAGPDFGALLWTGVQARPYQGEDRALAEAAAKGIAANFASLVNGVQVTGLMWYPTFAAAPGPVAPPTANVPCRLASLAISGTGGVTNASMLQGAMKSRLMVPPGTREQQQARDAALAAIAQEVATYFQRWLNSQLVCNVMGTGPVAGYSPPRVVAGPVTGGHVLPGGPHLP